MIENSQQLNDKIDYYIKAGAYGDARNFVRYYARMDGFNSGEALMRIGQAEAGQSKQAAAASSTDSTDKK